MDQMLDILLPRHTLEEALGPELAKQYRLRRGDGCLYMPVRSADRYLCTCGWVNPIGHPCGKCGLEPELLDRQVMEDLRREAEERVAREDEERARLEAQQREQEAQLQKQRRRQKLRRLVTAVAAGIALVALGLWSFWAITRIAIPAAHYQDALEALEKGEYQEAHRQFVLAGDYKDATEYLTRFYTPCLSVRSTEGYVGDHALYQYDAQGRLTLVSQAQLEIDADGQTRQDGEPTEYAQLYDRNGNVLVEQDAYGKTVYTYNEKGDVVSEVNYRPEGDQGYSKSFIYFYDEQGRVEQRNEICSNLISLNYSYEQIIWYTYDEAGRVATQIMETNYPASAESSYRSEIRWTYDSQGRHESMEERIVALHNPEDESLQRAAWRYDGDGWQVQYRSATEYLHDPYRNLIHAISYAYDSQGRILEERVVSEYPNDAIRNTLTVRVCTYDWEGRLVRETETVEYADEERMVYSGYTRTDTYTYDLLGRRVKRVQDWNHGRPERSSLQTEIYHYGADGMVDRAEVRVETEEGVTEHTVAYNDNGLAERVEYERDSGGSVSEYTYAYFYYPQEAQRPENAVAPDYDSFAR